MQKRKNGFEITAKYDKWWLKIKCFQLIHETIKTKQKLLKSGNKIGLKGNAFVIAWMLLPLFDSV